ncbi:MAG TPA: hypothetical protein ENJ95_04100 [Bacteroidetes bacterium]|nr:hypothetical protein [Bacteroidota bacterium]
MTIICLLLCSTYSSGQETFTTNHFLAGAEQQESVVFQNQKLEFLTSISHELPMIEKLEFRTETNQLDFRKQEFLLRVSPNSFKNMETQRQYQTTVKNLTELELEETWGKALRERYDLLVDYIYFKKITAIKNKQEVLFKDKVTLLERSIALPGFDVLDLIAAEDEEQQNIRDILDLDNAIKTYEMAIQKMDNTVGPIQIKENNLLDITGLKNNLLKIKPMPLADHPQLKVLSAKKYSNMLEYEWEVAKSKFSLGYIQAKYANDPNDNFRKSISIGIGFEIPLKGAAQLDMNELQIKVFESESEYKNREYQLSGKIYSTYQRLQNLIKKYDLVNQQLNDSQAEFALKEYSKIAEASPQAMLKLRENTLKKELLLQKLELDIMRAYIEYLDYSGLIGQRPYVNYLSKNMERF